MAVTDGQIKKLVREGEKAEPLGDGYYIIQSETHYRFGSDAVSLAHFAARDTARNDRVLDLCSGCGIIGIMLAISTGAQVEGVEIDKDLWDMSVRSAELNGLGNAVFVCRDARETISCLHNKYDRVVCNPPYYKANSKPAAVAPAANSEISITLADVVGTARAALKTGGALYMTHVTSRLDEVILACRDNGLTVKKLVIDPNGKTFMIKAVRGGKPQLTLEIKEY